MIDLHAHVLPLVDDGSESLDLSIDMLRESSGQGVTDMVLTPHLNKRYDLSVDKINCAFESFTEKAKNAGCAVNLYLGQEIYVGRSFEKVFSKGEFLTMNNTPFVLLEFDYNVEFDIAETVYRLKRQGYKPIVAHFERYSYADISDAREIKDIGGYIQVNADSCISGLSFFGDAKIKSLFRENLVDFVSSDVHSFRKSRLKKAKETIEKKYGEQVADAVFNKNALEIIKG